MDSIADWNERLQSCRERMQLAHKWDGQLRRLKEEIGEQRRVTEQCRLQLRAEEADVEQLRASSLQQFMLRLFGRLDDKLDQEEREAAEAKLKYDAAWAAQVDLELRQSELIALLADNGSPERECERLIADKQAWIKTHDPAMTARLEAYSEEIGERQAALKEVKEAIAAGNAVASALDSALEKLRSARSWGTYDMLGGGMIATMVKHGRIDDARDYIHQAQNALSRFKRELQDIKWQTSPDEVRIEGFTKFADYFFDGLIADWIVQGRIRSSLESVESQRSDIGSLLSKLGRMKADHERRIEGLRLESRMLIEQL